MTIPKFARPLIKVKEVADILDVSGETIRTMCKLGKLDSVRVGNQFRIYSDSLNLLLDRKGGSQ